MLRPYGYGESSTKRFEQSPFQELTIWIELGLDLKVQHPQNSEI